MARLKMRGVWLHDPADPDGTAHHFRYNEDGADVAVRRPVTHTLYAGRARPVADFGQTREQTLQVTLDLDDDTADLRRLQKLFDRNTVLCYRDGRGRRLFGTVDELSTSPTWWGQVATFTFTEVDYVEGED